MTNGSFHLDSVYTTKLQKSISVSRVSVTNRRKKTAWIKLCTRIWISFVTNVRIIFHIVRYWVVSKAAYIDLRQEERERAIRNTTVVYVTWNLVSEIVTSVNSVSNWWWCWWRCIYRNPFMLLNRSNYSKITIDWFAFALFPIFIQVGCI